MNLSYKGIYLERPKKSQGDYLLYVEFVRGKQVVKWYPRWGDLHTLITFALGVERNNDGRLQDFLVYSLVFTLYQHLVEKQLATKTSLSTPKTRQDIYQSLYFTDDLIRVINGYPEEYLPFKFGDEYQQRKAEGLIEG